MSEARGDVVILRLPIPLESMATVQEFVERVYGTGDTRMTFDGDHMRIVAPKDGWGERKRGRGKLPSAVNDALRLTYAELRDGKAKLTLEDMETTVLYISEITQQWFNHVGGINYVETKLVPGDQDEPSYVFIMQKADGKTAHELRQEAEARAEAAEATLERVRATVEAEKHYTEECGWDVPAIRVLAALAPVTEEGDKDAAQG